MSYPLEQPYVFGDVDAAVVAFLRSRSEMAGVTVGVKLPADLDKKLPFLFVSRIPGGLRTEGTFDDARVDIESRGKTRESAHDTIQMALALLAIMYQYPHTGMIIYRVGIEAGPGWNPDPLTDQPRWIATTTIRNRPKN